jgi:hypothetical protein
VNVVGEGTVATTNVPSKLTSLAPAILTTALGVSPCGVEVVTVTMLLVRLRVVMVTDAGRLTVSVRDANGTICPEV